MNHSAHRQGVADPSPAGAAPRADGTARAQLSKLYFGAVTAGSTPRALTGGVCYCCKTALAVGAGGGIYAAWRHVYPGNVRDIAFTMSADGGKTFRPPVRVSSDGWVLDGCPENGPTMAVDSRRRIHLVWPTLVKNAAGEPTLALFYAMSSDGRRFTPRQQIRTGGAARHAQLALGAEGELLAVWDEPAGGGRRIAMARGTVAANGIASFNRQAVEDHASATYPVVAVTHEGPVVAWTSASKPTETVIRVARVGS